MTSVFLAAVLVLSGFGFGDNTPSDLTHTAAEPELVTFRPDKTHSRIGFKVRHMAVANVRGAFNEYHADVRFDPNDVSTLTVDASVETASIDTRNERRDNHLRSDDFFNAEQFPTLRFVSKEVRNVQGNTFELVGDLTIRDVTKEVVLDSEFIGIGPARNGRKAGFEARTTIDRFEFGLRWDSLTEAGGLVVGEDVEIILELELNEVTSDTEG